MQNMDFWFFWNIFRRRWPVIIIVACIGGAAAGIYSKFFTAPVYRSSMSFYMGRITTDHDSVPGTRRSNNNEVIDISRSVVLGARLSEDYLELINMNVIDGDVYAALAKDPRWNHKTFRVSSNKEKESRIVQISIDSDDPEYSFTVAQLYAKCFIHKVKELIGLQNTQMLTAPSLSDKPVSMGVLRNTALGGIAGFVAAFAIFVVIRVLDRTIRTSDEVENALRVPVVGIVHQGENQQRKQLIFGNKKNDDQSQIADDFRVFRMNLINRSKDDEDGGEVVAVTSSKENEGKTFCTANLSAALAEAGYKVLLIDCDNTRKGLQTYLGTTNEKGLINILSNETDFESAVKHNMNNVENMDVLFSGDHNGNYANLMVSPQFKQLIKKVKQEYDYTFLDVSCHLGKGDIASAGSAVDSILLLVNAGKTEGALAKQTVNALKRANLNVSGVIINGVEDDDK